MDKDILSLDASDLDHSIDDLILSVSQVGRGISSERFIDDEALYNFFDNSSSDFTQEEIDESEFLLSAMEDRHSVSQRLAKIKVNALRFKAESGALNINANVDDARRAARFYRNAARSFDEIAVIQSRMANEVGNAKYEALKMRLAQFSAQIAFIGATIKQWGKRLTSILHRHERDEQREQREHRQSVLSNPIALYGSSVGRSAYEELLMREVACCKFEIIQDVCDNIVPIDVDGFSSLHDHVDANSYGGMTNDLKFDEIISSLTDIVSGDKNAELIKKSHPNTVGGRQIEFAITIQFLNDRNNLISDWIESGRMKMDCESMIRQEAKEKMKG